MNAAENPQIEVLLAASADDQSVFQFPLPDRVYGFHAQQAVEKLLKALITAHGERFEFTHDLAALDKQLRALGETLPSLPMSFPVLTAFAVEARYETPQPLSESTRAKLSPAIALLRTFVKQRIGELSA